MALPGHRRTSSDKRRRASHFALKKLSLAECAKCHEPTLPHSACSFCGTYANRQVLKLVEESGSAAKKAKSETPAPASKK